MQGRYGADNLHNFLTAVFFSLLVVNLFVGSLILYIIELFLVAYDSFRILSRNRAARWKENMAYLRIKKAITSFFKISFLRVKECKTHRYRKCVHCKATLRLPNKKGTHTVVCPHCKGRFEVKI